MKEPIQFRADKRTGEIIAVVPGEGMTQTGVLTVYARMGQHQSAQLDWVRRCTRPATPEEYADLLAELRSLGYDPRPVRRITRKMLGL